MEVQNACQAGYCRFICRRPYGSLEYRACRTALGRSGVTHRRMLDDFALLMATVISVTPLKDVDDGYEYDVISSEADTAVADQYASRSVQDYSPDGLGALSASILHAIWCLVVESAVFESPSVLRFVMKNSP